jgi:hypothetical protein
VSTLAEKLTKEPRRPKVIEACCVVIDEEVKSKTGLSAMVIKGGYGVVKAFKPRFVQEVVNSMLDQWVDKLEPHWTGWQAKKDGKPFPDYLAARGPEVAEALLSVTDARAKSAKSGAVKKMYEKMRPSAKKHVEEALPRLGRMVEREAAVEAGK